MSSKKFASIMFGVLMIAIIASFASASPTLANNGPVVFPSTQSVGTFTLTWNNNFNITNPSFPANFTLTGTDQKSATFTVRNMGSLSNVSSAKFNATIEDLNPDNLFYGKSYSFPLNITGKYVNGSETNSTNVNFRYTKTFCNFGDINASTSNGLSMSVYVTNDGSGTQSNWDPLDVVEVQVTVYNNGNNNFNPSNLYLELGLIQQGTNNNIANRLDWLSSDGSKVSIGNLPSGESYTYTFKFKVDPKILSTLSSGSQSYYLMLKTYSNSNGPKDACVDYSTSSDLNDNFVVGGSNEYALDVQISSPSYNDAVIIDPTTVPLSTTASCGQQVTLTPEVYNIGSSGNTYSKQQVLVTLYSPLFGTLNQTLYGGLNPGEGTQVPLTFKVPLNADEKQYPVYFNVYYGYTDTNGNYYGHYRYVASPPLSTNVAVSGKCVYATSATTKVQAQLESGGKAGEPLVVQATITNSGNKTASYNFGLEGYTTWATLSGITPLNITLSPGQSQSVLLNMNVNKDASGGNKQFTLDVYSNGYLITQQPLQVPITAQFSLSSLTGGINGSSILLWGFNILLIVAIIVILVIVIVRRRK